MRQILEGSRCRVYTNRCEMTESGIWRVTEREMFRRNIESEGTEHGRQETTQLNKEFLVAMRLWDTPVLIPNTMVKT